MVRLLDELLQEINSPLEDNYSNGLFYGLAVLQQRDGKTFPMRRIGTEEGKQISPYDGNGLVFYHRQLAPVLVEPLEGAKGLNSYQLVTYNMRLIGVGARKNITSSTDMNNADIASDVMKLLGENPSLTSKERVLVSGRVVTDKSEVLETEFAGQTEFTQNVLRLIAFSIDYTIVQRQICLLAAPVPAAALSAFALSNQTQTLVTGTAITAMVATVTGNVTIYKIDFLDTILAGLSLDTATGEVTGSPTAAGSFDVCALDVDNRIVGVQTVTITLLASDYIPTDATGVTTQNWYDASTDDADDITVNASDEISAWVDRSTAGFDITQATTANKPQLILSKQNGKRGVLWVSASTLQSAGSVTTSADFWVFACALHTPPTSQSELFAADGNATQVSYNSSQALLMFAGATGVGSLDKQTFYETPAILSLHFNGASSEIYIDGTLLGTVNSGGNIMTGFFNLGNTSAKTVGFCGYIFEFFIQDVTTGLSAADRASNEQYLADKWGVTI